MHAVTHCIDITCIMKQWTPPWISLRFSVARQCGCVGKHRPSHVRCDLWPFPAAPIPVTRAEGCNPCSLTMLRRSRWLSDSGLWFPIATTGLWVWFLYTCHRHRRCTYSCARVMTVQNQSWPLEHTRFVPRLNPLCPIPRNCNIWWPFPLFVPVPRFPSQFCFRSRFRVFQLPISYIAVQKPSVNGCRRYSLCVEQRKDWCWIFIIC